MSATLLNEEGRRICFEDFKYSDEWHARASALSAPPSLFTELIERLAKLIASGAWVDAYGGFGAFVDQMRRQCPSWRTVLND